MKTQTFIWMMSGFILTVFLAAPAVLGEIYSWTDENGVRHYSDTPPGASGNVDVQPEIPHDAAVDQKNRQAHQEMVKQVEEEQQETEKKQLEERLKKTERKLEAAQRKAEQALDEAKEARNIAEEKQRYREVYVVPGIGPGGNRPQRPVPYDPYKKSPIPSK